MRDYVEKLTARVFLTSDKRMLVDETDKRGKRLFHGKSEVTRHEAAAIRALTGGAAFLVPLNDADAHKAEAADKAEGTKAPVAPPAPHPNLAPTGKGPDQVVDWGQKYKGQRFSELPDNYLAGLTKGNNPAARKAMAKAEIARRAAPAAPVAPPAPVEHGPDDVPNLGVHQGVAVRDLPLDYVTALSTGVEETHHGWATTELQRRLDEV